MKTLVVLTAVVETAGHDSFVAQLFPVVGGLLFALGFAACALAASKYRPW